MRALKWGFLAICLVCGGIFAAARFWWLPWLGDNREWVAARLSESAGVPVNIERLETDWKRLRPRLRLGGLTMHVGERTALRLEQVDATLAWSSLWHGMPYFHRLEIVGPEIELGREKDGVFTVAGFRIEPRAEGGDPLAWLFGQSRITVRDATLIWRDESRNAPPLRLTEAQFVFTHGLMWHSFELKAKPPATLAEEVNISGEVKHYDASFPKETAGRFYVGLERADLGSLAPWVDYPRPLQGRGNVHLWIDSDRDGMVVARADVNLEGVETVLAPEASPLRFARLRGRVQWQYSPGGDEFGARDLWLDTEENISSEPITFTLALRRDNNGTLTGGAASASLLDLSMLTRLAASLPPGDGEDARARLLAHDLKGRVRALTLNWEGGGITRGAFTVPREWLLKADFELVSLLARHTIPGLDSISGSINGNQNGGHFTFSGQDTHLDLPKVFERSRLSFASLGMRGGWKRGGDGRMEISFDAAEFANDDAAGTASGRYWPDEGRGVIDLVANLTRAEGTAVWRYMPLQTGQHVRDWLQAAIERGNVTEAGLVLKGPLSHFPFRDGSGHFLVTVKGNGMRLNYAPGWPAFDELESALRFEGPGLGIDVRSARVFGVRLEPVRVDIPDLREALMTVEGKASGPSADFLHFIDESPLSGKIGGFSGALRAEGNGQLALKLVMPLHETRSTQVSGEYRFAANRVRLAENEPALEAAEGNLRFTNNTLKIPSIRGRLFGEPCVITGESGVDNLALNARGKFAAAAARTEFNAPLLAWLGGSADWRAEMLFRHEDSRITVTSGLKGLRSRLPAPFAKEEDEVWPLEVVAVFRGPEASRLLTVKQGGRLDAALEREPSGTWHGGIGLNRPAAPSGSGVELAAKFNALDIDAWQWTLNAGEGEGEADSKEKEPLPLTHVALEAGSVRVFGYTFRDMKLRANAESDGWRTRIESADVQGEISWQRADDGLLSARLRRLALSGDNGGNATSDTPPPRSLPGLDVRAEQFAVGARELGRLDVKASNVDGGWRLDSFAIQHPAALLSGSGLWMPGQRHSKL
ncbi:MAG: TIGR02099 family protein, partial [Azoarcus sp.]|nr:TIGR02099 family protein [Azoarcus sp.]